jgi:membrane-bound serine protease (ClpP class)
MAKINKPNKFYLETMVGTSGRAVSELNPEGTVIIKGELWQAIAASPPVNSGELITVVAQEDLTLTVDRRENADRKGTPK